MEAEHNARLTSAEISQIWGSYQNGTLTICMIRYFLNHVEDDEIRRLLQYTLEISYSHVQKLTTIMRKENFAVPVGFTEDDVNVKAPRLYSDTFMLAYVQQIGKLGLNAHSVSTALAARSDLHSFFLECLHEYGDLHKKANQILLSKGLYIRPPHIPYPKQVEFVSSQHFLAGWFGERRPLTSLEITNLYDNMQRNSLGEAVLMGFSQAAKSKKVSQYMVRGRKIAAKHVEAFRSALSKDHVPAAMTWDSEVTTSTAPPFSDKLMMFHVTALIAIGIGYYGTSMATTMRRDIHFKYSRLTAEIGKYAEDGANLMIDHNWMEQPPLNPDRDELAKKQ
ncbi:DUF3231 family protein [Halobacillus naozhouensis]|uniref:DUF3231 family protein n=1 Tax=Halobacillus naozhouensis TaxID=554880 RepID=A0ABY8J110_9BACI|nr:DUF3231 family protein [Halobacillus naozhouensis]WFT76187.1 DUF3231 family protein [Halobacillus naozhouensis]